MEFITVLGSYILGYITGILTTILLLLLMKDLRNKLIFKHKNQCYKKQ